MRAPADPPELEVLDTTPDVLDHPEAGAKAIRGAVMQIAAYVFMMVLTALTVPLMTRHLGVVNFGRFVTASSIVMIVAGVTEFGLNGVATRDYALAAPAQRRALIANVLGLRTVLTVFGLAVAAALMVAAAYPAVMIAGMLVAGVGLVLLNTQQTYTIALTAQLAWGVATIFNLINTVVIAAGTLALVLIGASLFPFFYVSAASSLAALLAALVYMRGRVSLLPSFDLGVWRRMMRATLPYAAAATITVMYPRVGLIVVSVISGGHQTGYYSTSFKVIEVLAGMAGLIAGSAFPLFARAGRDDHERLRYATSRVGETALIAGTYITLSLILAAPFVIRVLGGAQFKPAVPVLRIQAFALLAGFVATTWSSTLLALRLHGDLLRATLVALVVAIALSLLLVPSLGARGAAIAGVAAEFLVAAGYLLALLRRHAHLRPSFAAFPRVALAAGVAALAALLPISSLAMWVVASVVYLAAIVALGVLPHEIVDALLGRGPRSATTSGRDAT